MDHEPKLDVPIWNFQNGQSPKGWGFARHIGYSSSLTGVGLINHCLVINHNIFTEFCLREDLNRKKRFLSGIRESPKPPPLTPIRATWSSLLDVKNEFFLMKIMMVAIIIMMIVSVILMINMTKMTKNIQLL